MAINEITAGRSYALPHPENKLDVDVYRVRAAIGSIDLDVTAILLAMAAKAGAIHGHAIADISGLSAVLDEKMARGTTFAFSDLSGVDLYGAANGQVVMRQGSLWIPAHLQVNNVVNLEAILDGKLANSASPGKLAMDINAAIIKAAPDGADKMGFWDSASSALRALSFNNFKAWVSSFLVGYAAGQALSQAQKRQALDNIGGAWEQIGSVQNAAAGTVIVAWTGLSAFRRLRLTWEIMPLNMDSGLILQTGVGGVPSSGSRDFDYAGYYQSGGGALVFVPTMANAFIPILNAVNVVPAQGQVSISQFNQPVTVKIDASSVSVYTGTGNFYRAQLQARAMADGARDCLRVLAPSGSFSGMFVLEGIR